MSNKNKSSKKKAPKKQRYFGIVKLLKGHKASWVSKEDKNGWSLGYAMNNRTVWLTGLRFKSTEEIEHAINDTGIIFVEKNN